MKCKKNLMYVLGLPHGDDKFTLFSISQELSQSLTLDPHII